MPLTDTAVRQAKRHEKPRKLADERGLFLLVQPNGSKWWRLKYRVLGKEKLLSLGVYPDVSLSQARQRREDARKLIAEGVDPSVNRQAQKAASMERSANSFEVVAREWFTKFRTKWVDSHSDKIIRRLERDVFPWIGGRPIAEVSAPELLKVLRRIEERGAVETAHRASQNCGQIFRYAVATGRAERDPSGDLRGALASPQATHHAAITDPKQLAAMLRAIDGYEGSLVTRSALQLAPQFFVRPGELRAAEWEEFDLDGGVWNIAGAKMKTREPHIVPLSKQAVKILRDLELLTGSSKYVFPGARTNGRPMSNVTVNAALRRLGFASDVATGHGFRATARTILDEELSFPVDWIEHQLAHAVKDPNGRAYNRTAHLPQRRQMMQAWADYLDKIKAGAAVIPMKKSA